MDETGDAGKKEKERKTHLNRCRSSSAPSCIALTNTLLTATASVAANPLTVSLATIALSCPYFPAAVLTSERKSLQEKERVAW
jgi:hypothetical protein